MADTGALESVMPSSDERPETETAGDDDFHGKPLTRALKAWMDSEEWSDEIEVKDDGAVSLVRTQVTINDQPHRTFLEANEDSETFSVFVYSPMHVPPARMADMARLLNRINMRLRLGRLGCHDDTDTNPVQFLARIDVEGGALAAGQVDTLVGSAFATFRQYDQVLAAVALTRQPVDELWKNFLDEEAAKEAAREQAEAGSGPSEL